MTSPAITTLMGLLPTRRSYLSKFIMVELVILEHIRRGLFSGICFRVMAFRLERCRILYSTAQYARKIISP